MNIAPQKPPRITGAVRTLVMRQDDAARLWRDFPAVTHRMIAEHRMLFVQQFFLNREVPPAI